MHFRKPGRWVDLQGLNREAKAIEATDTVEDPASPITGKLITPPPPHKSATVIAATKLDLMEELTLAPVPLLVGERVNSTATKPSMSKLRAAVDVEKGRERRAIAAADSWRNRTTAKEDGVSKPSPPLVELRMWGAVEIEIVPMPWRNWKFRKRGRYQRTSVFFAIVNNFFIDPG
ncbi:unnamed protein product [Linum trigynum]|uniref:Uncharacterized protein n=1 Tax=Linum trigynum TaxID=586398 RepID=A0AAV2DGR8_9ROSI